MFLLSIWSAGLPLISSLHSGLNDLFFLLKTDLNEIQNCSCFPWFLAALSPLRQQNLQPMDLDLDFNTTSSKEASGPFPMGDEVAPMARQPPSRPLPSCTSPSTEHILLPEASRSLAQDNDATSVAMAEQGTNRFILLFLYDAVVLWVYSYSGSSSV